MRQQGDRKPCPGPSPSRTGTGHSRITQALVRESPQSLRCSVQNRVRVKLGQAIAQRTSCNRAWVTSPKPAAAQLRLRLTTALSRRTELLPETDPAADSRHTKDLFWRQHAGITKRGARQDLGTLQLRYASPPPLSSLHAPATLHALLWAVAVLLHFHLSCTGNKPTSCQWFVPQHTQRPTRVTARGQRQVGNHSILHQVSVPAKPRALQLQLCGSWGPSQNCHCHVPSLSARLSPCKPALGASGREPCEAGNSVGWELFGPTRRPGPHHVSPTKVCSEGAMLPTRHSSQQCAYRTSTH